MTQASVKTIVDASVTLEEIEQQFADNSWPVPDLSLLRTGTIAPPPFDDTSLPELWATWCQGVAKGKGCPMDFVAANLLTCASAWLGNARRVSPSPDWIEPPHLWTAIIGQPSGGKTPSLQIFVEVSKALEREAEPEWERKQAEHEKLAALAKAKFDLWQSAVKEAAKNSTLAPDLPHDAVIPEPPAKPRTLVCEATTQEVVNMLRSNPKGLLQIRDELAGWIGSMDRYNSGKGADRAFYLESWNGGRYTVDLVKNNGKPIVVPYSSLAMLGGFQPDKLREALAGSDDGLAARFIYVWPLPAPYLPLSHGNEADSNARTALLLNAAKRLRGLSMAMNDKGDLVARIVKLTPEAQQMFEDMRRESIMKAQSFKGLEAGWYGKTPSRALRLALTIEYLIWGVSDASKEPTVISGEAMGHALSYLDYLSKMLERVIGGLVHDEAEEDATAIMQYILSSKADLFQNKNGVCFATLNERTLSRTTGFNHLRDTTRRKEAFKVLARDGWVRPVHVEGKGRKPSTWSLNPALMEVEL